MKLHQLKPIKTTKPSRRVGRGPGSTKGKTSGRGHKGYNARTGSTQRLGFEGGQMKLMHRIPKLKGFTAINSKDYSPINLGNLEALADDGKITRKMLIDKGVVGKKDLIKILGKGELTAKIDVQAHAFSATAKEAIEKAGGKTTVINIK